MIGLISQVNSAPKVSLAHNCKEVYNGGCTTSGVYTIDPGCGKPFQVCCDMDGQWEVIQGEWMALLTSTANGPAMLMASVILRVNSGWV